MKAVYDHVHGNYSCNIYLRTNQTGMRTCTRNDVNIMYSYPSDRTDNQSFLNELLAEPDPNDEEDHVSISVYFINSSRLIQRQLQNGAHSSMIMTYWNKSTRMSVEPILI